MDSLPKSHGFEVILVVVDRLTKYIHFLPLSHPYTAAKVDIFRLHGMPQSIVSGKDVVFTSKFWVVLFRLQGSDVTISPAYHPQTDGQTEVVNRSLEQYLRAFVSDKPHTWVDWFHLADFWFNNNYHTSTKLTPYETLYGFLPPRLLDYVLGTTKVEAMDQLLKKRSEVLSLLKHKFFAAQSRMKLQSNQHRIDRSFKVGEWVYLRLQPYRHLILRSKGFNKLSPRFYGPFQVLQKLGPAAYKLALPSNCLIHPVFHVSCLKKKLGAQITPIPTLLLVDSDGSLHPEPITIEVLVQWQGQAQKHATWESFYALQHQFPHLVGKVL